MTSQFYNENWDWCAQICFINVYSIRFVIYSISSEQLKHYNSIDLPFPKCRLVSMLKFLSIKLLLYVFLLWMERNLHSFSDVYVWKRYCKLKAKSMAVNLLMTMMSSTLLIQKQIHGHACTHRKISYRKKFKFVKQPKIHRKPSYRMHRWRSKGGIYICGLWKYVYHLLLNLCDKWNYLMYIKQSQRFIFLCAAPFVCAMSNRTVEKNFVYISCEWVFSALVRFELQRMTNYKST